MKHAVHFFLLCSLLFLSGCIEIDDSREMWKKAQRDPVLEGLWSYHNDKDPNAEIAFVKFVAEDGHYRVETYDKNRKRFMQEDATFFIKTIKTGGASYMLAGFPHHPDKSNGLIWPYRIRDGRIETTQIKTCASCTNTGESFSSPRLKTLSDENLSDFDAILAATPDWELWMEGTRVSP